MVPGSEEKEHNMDSTIMTARPPTEWCVYAEENTLALVKAVPGTVLTL